MPLSYVGTVPLATELLEARGSRLRDPASPPRADRGALATKAATGWTRTTGGVGEVSRWTTLQGRTFWIGSTARRRTPVGDPSCTRSATDEIRTRFFLILFLGSRWAMPSVPRLSGELSPFADPQLGEYVGQVRLDGAQRHEEAFGDLGVGEAFRH